MKKKNMVETVILNIIEEYMRNDKNNIIGIYMVPYRIGTRKKIELVVVLEEESEKIKLRSQRAFEYEIISSMNLWENYSIDDQDLDVGASLQFGSHKNRKNLRNGIIVYDPKKLLFNKREELIKKKNITQFFNGIMIPTNCQEKILRGTIIQTQQPEKEKQKKI